MKRKTALSFSLCCVLVALGAVSAGCQPSLTYDNSPLSQTFAVSDIYTPSGYMGDGEFFGKLVGKTNEGCKPRPPNARGNCYVFTYFPNTVDQDPWAGVYWTFPANNWGDTPGHAIHSGNFQQISFYAAVVGPNPYTFNGAPQFFNGLTGNINPNGGFTSRGGLDHADAVYAATAAQVGTDITGDLKQFHIPLTDLSKGQLCYSPGAAFAPNCETVTNSMGMQISVADDLIGAFAWSVHYPSDQVKCSVSTSPCPTSKFVNPPPVTIYLDDIVWDTEPAPTP
jgi:hypothetical protein